MAGTAVLPTYVTCITSPPPHIQRRLSLSSPHRVSLPSHLRPSQLCSLTLSSQPRRVNMAAVSARGNITGSAVGGVKRNSFFCHTSMDSALSVFYPSLRHNIVASSAIGRSHRGGEKKDYLLRQIPINLALNIGNKLAEAGEGSITDCDEVPLVEIATSAMVLGVRHEYDEMLRERAIIVILIGCFSYISSIYTSVKKAKKGRRNQ